MHRLLRHPCQGGRVVNTLGDPGIMIFMPILVGGMQLCKSLPSTITLLSEDYKIWQPSDREAFTMAYSTFNPHQSFLNHVCGWQLILLWQLALGLWTNAHSCCRLCDSTRNRSLATSNQIQARRFVQGILKGAQKVLWRAHCLARVPVFLQRSQCHWQYLARRCAHNVAASFCLGKNLGRLDWL